MYSVQFRVGAAVTRRSPPTDPYEKISLIRFVGSDYFRNQTGTIPFGA